MGKSLINFLAGLQLFLGGVGVVGIVLYLLEPDSNSSRYQMLALPFWAVLVALPLIIVSLLAYRRHCGELSNIERSVFCFGCFFPVATFCVAMAVSGF